MGRIVFFLVFFSALAVCITGDHDEPKPPCAINECAKQLPEELKPSLLEAKVKAKAKAKAKGRLKSKLPDILTRPGIFFEAKIWVKVEEFETCLAEADVEEFCGCEPPVLMWYEKIKETGLSIKETMKIKFCDTECDKYLPMMDECLAILKKPIDLEVVEVVEVMELIEYNLGKLEEVKDCVEGLKDSVVEPTCKFKFAHIEPPVVLAKLILGLGCKLPEECLPPKGKLRKECVPLAEGDDKLEICADKAKEDELCGDKPNFLEAVKIISMFLHNKKCEMEKETDSLKKDIYGCENPPIVNPPIEEPPVKKSYMENLVEKLLEMEMHKGGKRGKGGVPKSTGGPKSTSPTPMTPTTPAESKRSYMEKLAERLVEMRVRSDETTEKSSEESSEKTTTIAPAITVTKKSYMENLVERLREKHEMKTTPPPPKTTTKAPGTRKVSDKETRSGSDEPSKLVQDLLDLDWW